MNRTHFWIPAADPKDAENELNQFVRLHRVLSLDEVLVANGADSAWAVSVSWLDDTRGSTTQRKGKIDYREVLDPDTFALYASLRRRRRELSDVQGVPAYTVATNEQLAEIARRRVKNVGELRSIPGFGQARVDRYGATLAEWMKEALADAGVSSAGGQSSGGQ